MLAKKGDIKQASATTGIVFMVWAKQLQQVEGLDLPIQIKELLEEFKDMFLVVPYLFVELSIKLIWCQELHFLTDQHTDVIQRKQKRFKGRLVRS